jgi:phospholipid/cholesterol/gamma-HCH transport system permease protein
MSMITRIYGTLIFMAASAVLTFNPLTYRHRRVRQSALQEIGARCLPILPGFLLVSSFISMVIVQIVTATAVSYGLSQFAVEVLVRSLILELIPLYVSLFVLIRIALPMAYALSTGPLRLDSEQLRERLVPHAVSCLFAIVLLTLLASLIALTISYLTVFGFSPWGLPEFTASIGRIFDPSLAIVFMGKAFFFGLTIVFLPLSIPVGRQDLALLFGILLLIEAVSLVALYY